MPRLAMRTCTSTRTGLHPVSHASLVTKGARRANEEGPRRASSVGSRTIARSCAFTFARLFRPTRIPCPAGPLEQCRSWGQRLSGFWGLPLEGERRGIQRVARCGASSSNLLCIQKRKSRASVKSASCVATTAGPTPAAGEDSARRIRARVSYFENSLQKSKGCDWLREASASIRQAGVHGGLAEAIAFANATRYRNGETAQWDGTLAAKPTKAGQARDMGSHPRGARQTSQDGGR